MLSTIPLFCPNISHPCNSPLLLRKRAVLHSTTYYQAVLLCHYKKTGRRSPLRSFVSALAEVSPIARRPLRSWIRDFHT